jgi:mitogen-activated protein kinase kinase
MPERHDRSLDNVYKEHGPIPEPVLGKIAVAVVSGLTYLYDVHRIIHRGNLPSFFSRD